MKQTMKLRIGGQTIGRKGHVCSHKECQKELTDEPIYEWKWFIQDGHSNFDGEEHHVKLCRTCYTNMEKMFVGHVTSSNVMTNHIAYGESYATFSPREKERFSKEYNKQLQDIEEKVNN